MINIVKIAIRTARLKLFRVLNANSCLTGFAKVIQMLPRARRCYCFQTDLGRGGSVPESNPLQFTCVRGDRSAKCSISLDDFRSLIGLDLTFNWHMFKIVNNSCLLAFIYSLRIWRHIIVSMQSLSFRRLGTILPSCKGLYYDHIL